jgi:hypothetical protein
MSSVKISKELSNDSEQKYYLCDYQYKGDRWWIEIPAESWEDAKARLERLAYGRVVGEIKATLPLQFVLWTQLLIWLKRLR